MHSWVQRPCKITAKSRALWCTVGPRWHMCGRAVWVGGREEGRRKEEGEGKKGREREAGSSSLAQASLSSLRHVGMGSQILPPPWKQGTPPGRDTGLRGLWAGALQDWRWEQEVCARSCACTGDSVWLSLNSGLRLGLPLGAPKHLSAQALPRALGGGMRYPGGSWEHEEAWGDWATPHSTASGLGPCLLFPD